VRSRVPPDLAATIAAHISLGVAAALTGVRSEVHPEVVAVALAVIVAVAGQLGGRASGVTAALVAAASFDFFHTRPYLSLKIEDVTDILVTVLLLAVGLVVGTRPSDRACVARVLAVARTGKPSDVELAVRAELVSTLSLHECRFVRDGGSGIPVEAYGETFGHLVCRPRIIDRRARRLAEELGAILGLSLSTRTPT
jgi:hypothetical protein